MNWESLPNDYRESTIPLWTHYGLFPKRDRALQTILGAAKYDISARDILVELGRRGMVGGQEDMIEDTALTLAKARRLSLTQAA